MLYKVAYFDKLQSCAHTLNQTQKSRRKYNDTVTTFKTTAKVCEF